MIDAAAQAMYVTPFGLAWLVVLVMVIGLWRRALPALVLGSSVFQATAVITIDAGRASYGVSPWQTSCVAAALVLAVRTARDRGLRLARPRGYALHWLGVYIVMALAGSALLPTYFTGLPVYTPLSRWGFDVPPVPLAWSLSNAVQAITLCGHAVVLLFLLQAQARDPAQRRLTPLGLAAGAVAMLAILAWEWLAWAASWPSLERVWLSNPGYNLALGEVFLSGRRMFAPFSEPSYGSAFLAAIAMACLALALFGRHPWRATAALILAGAALLGTAGATGLAAAGVFGGVLLAWATWRGARGGRTSSPMHRARLAWLVLLATTAGGLAVISALGLRPQAQAIVAQAVLEKADSESGRFRERSNRDGLYLLQRTAGLGVGLGSNRASSYAVAIASNLGIAGLLAWLGVLWSVARARTADDDMTLAVGAAFAAATLALAIGIPDITLPFYWAMLFALLMQLVPGRP